jgi:uncharacterized damage-inducible protein DinB
MTYYGTKEIADSFRTVRRNTITLADEIPADQYDFTPAAGLRSVRGQLAHISVATRWQVRLHRDRVTFVDFERFGAEMARGATEEQALATKDQIVAALRADGEEFTSFVESLEEERLADTIGFPIPPPTKSRFELLLGVKEHEMHHRAQLMLVQRLLGIVPHLTRQREAARVAAAAGKA